MSSKILRSANLGNFSLGNGSSHVPLSVKFPLLESVKPLWISDFYIEAPRVKIDDVPKELVENVSKSLVKKPFKYKSRTRKDWMLKEILGQPDAKRTDAKSKLVRDGHSANIAEVSAMINRSNADHTTKFLLSSEPIYVYALSFVIYYEKVTDPEGINDRVIAFAESEVKSYFNTLLAKTIIEERHLDLTGKQKREIYHAAAKTTISFIKGAPVSAISRIINKYVDNGELHALVDKFFQSGEIDPEKGTPQIRQLMVDYLNEIGLIIPEDELDEGSTGDSGFIETTGFEDDDLEDTTNENDDLT